MGQYGTGYYIEWQDGTLSKRMSKVDACYLAYPLGDRVICAQREKGWLGWWVSTIPTLLVEKCLYERGANDQA